MYSLDSVLQFSWHGHEISELGIVLLSRSTQTGLMLDDGFTDNSL